MCSGVDSPVIGFTCLEQLAVFWGGVKNIPILLNFKLKLLRIFSKINQIADGIEPFHPDQIQIRLSRGALICCSNWESSFVGLMARYPVVAIAILIGTCICCTSDHTIGNPCDGCMNPFDFNARINQARPAFGPKIEIIDIPQFISDVCLTAPPCGDIAAILWILDRMSIKSSINCIVMGNRQIVSLPLRSSVGPRSQTAFSSI